MTKFKLGADEFLVSIDGFLGVQIVSAGLIDNLGAVSLRFVLLDESGEPLIFSQVVKVGVGGMARMGFESDGEQIGVEWASTITLLSYTAPGLAAAVAKMMEEDYEQ